MQSLKNFTLTAQEAYHAKLAISSGNYETKLAKAIQRKLLNRMLNGPEHTIPCRPILEYLDNESCVKFMRDAGGNATDGRVLEYLRQFGESAAAPILTCQFVVISDAIDVFYEDQPYDSVGYELFIAEMKAAELAKHFTAEMACMIDTGTVAYFDCVESDIVDRDGARIVTFNVIPVYAIR